MNKKVEPLIHIILVNWNGYVDTRECIASVEKIVYPNYKIVVVDNGSEKDETVDLKQEFPGIITCRTDKNLGFSGGSNIGIQASLDAGADYILLLNNDTIVEPDFLDELINAFNDNDNTGIAVPKINFYINKNLIWYAGGYISKLRSSGFTRGEGKTDVFFNKSEFVTFATGCCLLIKSSVISKIGLMDEAYFLYLEDADYCMRTLQQGFKIKYFPRSKIYHKVNISTTKTNSLLPFYYTTRNRLYFAKKFHNRLFPVTSIIMFTIFIGKSLYWLVTGEKKRLEVLLIAINHYFNKKMGPAFL